MQNKTKKKIYGLPVIFSVRFLMLTLFLSSLTVHKPLLYIAAFNFSSLHLAAPGYFRFMFTEYIAAFNFSSLCLAVPTYLYLVIFVLLHLAAP